MGGWKERVGDQGREGVKDFTPLALEMEQEPVSQGTWQPLEAGKGKETYDPLGYFLGQRR